MKIRIVAVSLAVTMTVFAEARSLDLSSRLSSEFSYERTLLKSRISDGTCSSRVIISMDSISENAVLESLGINPDLIIGHYVLASVTPKQLAALDTVSGVSQVSSVRKKRLLMDKARESGRVDELRSNSKYSGYKGKNVIIGIIDNGFDPNHITFADSEGASRVKRFWNYNSSGSITEYTSDNIASFTTDDSRECHATHVSAIAAGGYDNKYNGVASESDILMAAGDLGDDMILSAVSKMIDYARNENKPLVINLSIGDNIGPHDGSDAFTSALNQLAEDAVICLAAGNEADYDIAVKKTLSETDNSVKTILMPNSDLRQDFGSRYQAYCDVQIWSDDSAPFSAYVAFVNKSTGEVIEKVEATQSVSIYSVGNADVSGLSMKTLSSNYTNSFFAMQKGVSQSNNRYYCEMSFDLCNRSSSPAVYPAIIVEGESRQTVRIYNDGWYTDFSNGNFSGYDSPTSDGTISNMACGKNTISVGAFVTKRLAPYNYGFTVGEAAYFSSWGTLADGRTLPDISAPGVAIVSALSTPHAQSRYYSSSDTPKTQSETVNGTTYYWTPMGGTSMATPFMSGTAAIWLQASPELDPSAVKSIAKETAAAPSDGNPQWGAGRLDVFEGLKKAVEMAGINDVAVDTANDFDVEISNGVITVRSANENSFVSTVFDLSGKAVASRSAIAGVTEFDYALAPGLYILTINGRSNSQTCKIFIK